MTPSLEEAQRFLGLARADIDAFLLLAANPQIRRAIAFFHGQQAVEKCLKATLLVCGVDFRHTHDLIELAGDVEEAGVTLPCSTEQLLTLNPFAVELRYDDQVIPRLSNEEATKIVMKTLAWAEAMVNASR